MIFVYGIGVGTYQWFPYNVLVTIKNSIIFVHQQQSNDYKGEEELLRFAFTNPVISGEMFLPPLETLDDVRKVNESIFLPVADFFDAYTNIQILEDTDISLKATPSRVKELSFELNEREYKAYAYFSLQSAGNHSRAILIIPGSGMNQSSSLLLSDEKNYHYGIMTAFTKDDVYVFIKPNEDAYAFYRERSKLNNSFIVNWHLNRGGSYSASYITQSLAFTKFLKRKYSEVIVVGLSQGGGAALLNSIQSEPAYAIIASGYSVMNKDVEWAGIDQIIIPNISSKLDAAVSALSQLKTRFLFTWGKREVGAYRIEAMEKITANKLSLFSNVAIFVHDGGHVFPVKAIVEFLNTEGIK
jgi:hypothetical protein